MFYILVLCDFFFCKFCLINRIPALATAVLLISGGEISDTIDSTSFYGTPQVTTLIEIILLSSAVYDMFGNQLRIT